MQPLQPPDLGVDRLLAAVGPPVDVGLVREDDLTGKTWESVGVDSSRSMETI